MSLEIQLSEGLSARLCLGQIKLSGLRELPPEKRRDAYNNGVRNLPEIKSRLIAKALEEIKKAGGEIHPDNKGLHFPKAVELNAAREAWACFLDLRPLLVKQIHLFSVNGKEVSARHYNGHIKVVWPRDLNGEEYQQAMQILTDYPICFDDFNELETAA